MPDPALIATCALALPACGLIAWGSWVDVRERRIPNACTLGVAICAAVQMAVQALLLPSAPPPLGGVGERLAWAAGALLALLALELAWRRLRGSPGLGMGDIKLIAALALWVGAGIVAVLAVSCLLASAVALVRRQHEFAFGPYLGLAGCACLVLSLLV